jgi:hypothetical protein
VIRSTCVVNESLRLALMRNKKTRIVYLVTSLYATESLDFSIFATNKRELTRQDGQNNFDWRELCKHC